MENATRDLLLKVRKGATASFGTKQWTIVLEAMGLKVTTAKEGRQVVRADVSLPNGVTLTIRKEPHYKWIVWYELGPWLKSHNINLVEVASILLGMDTPDEEKRLKHLYERDLTNTGTCGVCNGNFKREADGGLHMHGFTRPGDGSLHGRCFGVGYQPHEISPDGAKNYLEKILRVFLADAQEIMGLLRANKVTSYSVKEWNSLTGVYDYKTVTKADKDAFQKAREDKIRATERDIEWATKDVARFEKIVAEWKADDLPEIKYAAFLRKR